jgi:hypothetical protein
MLVTIIVFVSQNHMHASQHFVKLANFLAQSLQQRHLAEKILFLYAYTVKQSYVSKHTVWFKRNLLTKQ